MKSNYTKYFFFLLMFFTCSFSQAQNTDSQLASQYFLNNEFEKAAELYEKLYKKNNSKVYFGYYLKCLLKLENYKTAEKQIKKQIKRNKEELTYYVDLGDIYELQEKKEKAEKKYKEAINNIGTDKTQVIQLANAFVIKENYDYAEKTYLTGRKRVFPKNNFRLELATIYYVKNELQKMVDEYMELISEIPSELKTIQNNLQYSVAGKKGTKLRKILKTSLLKKIQSSSASILYSELLIWLYEQEKNFRQSFRQRKALDKRNNESGFRIMAIAELSLNNKDYKTAYEAYEYVHKKGKKWSYYDKSLFGMLNVIYQQIEAGEITEKEKIIKLESDYKKAIAKLNSRNYDVNMPIELAHIQAYYLDKFDEAIKLLEETMKKQRVKNSDIARVKIKLGDVYLISGDVWEAALIYAQVEETFKHNPIGHEAKFKKAKVAYYTGDFKWAQAQLDVLKASTSKLIANDACDLALLISENTADDSIPIALQKYANAELFILLKNDSSALTTLDSILIEFPNHTLADDVYLRKSEIMQKQKNLEKTVEYLEKIHKDYSQDILADDAIIRLAKIYDYELNNKEKAMKLYKEILLNHTGSIFVVEARKRFRELRGD